MTYYFLDDRRLLNVEQNVAISILTAIGRAGRGETSDNERCDNGDPAGVDRCFSNALQLTVAPFSSLLSWGRGTAQPHISPLSTR
jgi:hypothetical protein